LPDDQINRKGMTPEIFLIFSFLPVLAIMFGKSNLVCFRLAVFFSGLQLVLAAFLLSAFIIARGSGDSSRFVLIRQHEWFPAMGIRFATGVDGVSVAMILLTAIIVFTAVLVSRDDKKLPQSFFTFLFLLATGAYGFFMSLDLFMQFFFLELAVVPKFMLISVWGSGNNERSAMKLVLMLTLGSALIFVGLMGVFFGGAHTFLLTQMEQLSVAKQQFFFPFLFLGFGIFGAIFPFHTWVPDGHSSAPTAGSMFLAGISMKLGGYGCLRVAAMMPQGAAFYSTWIVVLATIAIVYGAFATMQQKDLKYINAYSSVSHCGFVLLGIGMLTKTAMAGAVLQMISHGLMTALFFAVIGMIYSRTHTREVSAINGLLKAMPFISALFVIAGLCSLGLPGLSGFAAEVTVFIGSWERAEMLNRILTILAISSIVITAVYILRVTGKVVMGVFTPVEGAASVFTDATWNERLAAIVLLAGIGVVGLLPFWLMKIIAPVTQTMVGEVVTNALTR
jgi:NADH-quinone oxidoreductase subunit M